MAGLINSMIHDHDRSISPFQNYGRLPKHSNNSVKSTQSFRSLSFSLGLVLERNAHVEKAATLYISISLQWAKRGSSESGVERNLST